MCKDMKNNLSFIAFRHKCFCPSGPGLRLWLLLAALWLCPQLLPAQQTRSGVHLTRTTVDEVMNYIEEHSDYTFLYNDKTVDRTRRVSVDNAAGDIRAILDAVFAGTDVRYDIRDNQIILSEKRSQKQAGRDDMIAGRVTDQNGVPLVGVSILVKGSARGTTTDVSGRFVLRIEPGDVLVASYLGYESVEVAADSRTGVEIRMQESSKALDAVVVTALGIKRSEKALSYNVQGVQGEDMNIVKDANFMNSLAGKVAGVSINASAGGVGGATRVVMRGTKSISGNNNALYVIDGVPILNVTGGSVDSEYGLAGGEGISDINPENIESVNVLTGPSAAALYGSAAANGVVLINTRKGSAGKPKITVSNNTTFSSPFMMPEFQNTYGNKIGIYASWGEKLAKPSSFDPADFFNTGALVQNNVSLSTGNDRHQTYISAGTTNGTGILPNHEYSRYNFTFRSVTKLWRDRLTLDYGGSYIIQRNQNMSAQGKYFNPLTAVYTFPRGEDFSTVQAYERFDTGRNMFLQYWPWGDQAMNMQNPYWVQYRNMRTNKRDRYMLNLNAKYQVNDWLNIAGRVRIDNTVGENEKKYWASTIQLFAGENGSYFANKQHVKLFYGDVIANVDKRLGKDFTLAANVGASWSRERSDLVGGGGKLDIANFFTLNNIIKEYRTLEQNRKHSMLTVSAFANLELGWRSMLYLTATARNDWASSQSGTEQLSFFYPSVGLSAVVTEMVRLPRWISFLKLRGSYAEVGSPLPQYLSSATYQFNSSTGYYETYTRFVPDKLYPEMTRSWEVGMDLRLWQERLTLDITYYKSNTNKQTFQIPISGSSGYSSMVVQSGCVQNKGVEAVLGVKLRSGDFSYNASFAYTLNRNKIKSMVPYYTTLDGQVGSLNQITKSNIDGGAASFLLREGGTMGDLWTKNVIKKDEDGNYLVNAGGKLEIAALSQKVGSVLPKYTLSMNNDFRYKGFRAGFQLHARVGGKVLSATQAYLDGYGVSKASAAARDNGGVPVNQGKVDAETWYTTIGTGKVYSHYIYNATNIRLQEASIGYTLPKRWFRDVCSIDISLVGRNLWLIYCKAPFDPESASSTDTYYQGIDFFMQPSLRSYGFSVKLNF
ncbi:SusC/RagA family TonB-linked outer membrane protein [Alistipes finegoldii]|uniref:SusC/RagA family TonB-linked outer membrane protein n=2 Tax=Alistipes finegoldii TaxID=214856 RepID=A0AA37KV11_9BACT|nr:SusC/RagA family TonB-linked outer membrane protein [Alistipes finegoldii]GKI20219.1 SusC/RagA family TonB-linked outer membrane protein [Alistipes finegoldii]